MTVINRPTVMWPRKGHPLLRKWNQLEGLAKFAPLRSNLHSIANVQICNSISGSAASRIRCRWYGSTNRIHFYYPPVMLPSSSMMDLAASPLDKQLESIVIKHDIVQQLQNFCSFHDHSPGSSFLGEIRIFGASSKLWVIRKLKWVYNTHLRTRVTKSLRVCWRELQNIHKGFANKRAIQVAGNNACQCGMPILIQNITSSKLEVD